MTVKLRLRRMGAHKRPSYRVVVADSRSPRDGRFLETVGVYNPLTNPPTVSVKGDRIRHWLDRGAQPTSAVERILRWTGTSRDAVAAPAASEETASDATE